MAAPPWVAKTQHALGPLVSAPPSSAALLRPTFHMLHSVVFEVKSTTTFGEGAYTAEEEGGRDALCAEDQIGFLCKAMGLVGASLGSPIRLQVSAALKGDEAEATNVFLQRLAQVRSCCMPLPRASTSSFPPSPRAPGGHSEARCCHARIERQQPCAAQLRRAPERQRARVRRRRAACCACEASLGAGCGRQLSARLSAGLRSRRRRRRWR